MNPETKATLEDIQAICAKHGIPYYSHSRINFGFLHEVHRLNDDLILKIYNTDEPKKFAVETALLASSAAFPKPQLIAKGKESYKEGRPYVIMTYIPGYSLGSRWHLASNGQRERLIKEICQTLRAINQLNPADVALETTMSWEVSLRKRAKQLVAQLRDKGILDTSTADKALQAVERNLGIFSGTKLLLVYWDVHFDNFIVDEEFEFQAIIDLENVQLTAQSVSLVRKTNPKLS